MWQEKFIAYCERTDFSYWSEPVNAVTNVAFVIAAAVVWPHTRGNALARLMVFVLVVIGMGSFLWHTHASAWAGLLDVLPILAFILLYLFAATRDYLRAPGWLALVVTALFLPYAGGVSWTIGLVWPAAGANAAYFSVAVLIASYGVRLRRKPVGRGLLGGAALLCVSLGFRMADASVCDGFAPGTHFMWHILNAAMLGWMIRIYCRHVAMLQKMQG